MAGDEKEAHLHSVATIRPVLREYNRSRSVSDELRPGHVGGLFVSWHRSQHDGLDHALTDEEMRHGREIGSRGQYESLCGHVVLVVSMLIPPGNPCLNCRTVLCARTTLPTFEQRMRQPTRHRKSTGFFAAFGVDSGRHHALKGS